MRAILPLSLFALGFGLLLGCGGGGGSGTTGTNGSTGCNQSNAVLTYRTFWSNGNGLTGQSELVTLRDANGNAVQSQVLNRQVGSSEFSFAQVATGTYVLSADLYSQADAQGVKVGEIRTQLSLCGSLSFESEAGTVPTSIAVTPNSATFSVQESRSFYASGSANGRAVFLSPGGVAWDALGGVATVNSTGIAFGTNPGNGSIRATYSSTGASGAAAITVTPLQVQTTKWTVLVYINAANDLFQFSDLNVNQMEQVAQNPQVRFVLQWKQAQSIFPTSSFNGTRRYLVKPDTGSQIASQLIQDMGTGVDMGRPDTLKAFIDWGKTYYPADRYVLVVWNHGNGWHRGIDDLGRAVSYDDDTGNAIQIWELKQALGNQQFDIIAWDASLMQMAEVAYEVKDNTKLVAGSEESPPGEGYPYQLIFAKFRDNPDDTTVNLSKAFVDGMLGNPDYATRKITQSVLDTTKLPALATAFGGLATSLKANVANIQVQVDLARDTAQSYSPRVDRVYRDATDLLGILKTTANIPADVAQNCTQVQSAAAAAIVWEGHNSNSPNSHGISIDFSPASIFVGVANDYNLMQFAQSSGWGTWLQVAP